jgi:hypothetical protein
MNTMQIQLQLQLYKSILSGNLRNLLCCARFRIYKADVKYSAHKKTESRHLQRPLSYIRHVIIPHLQIFNTDGSDLF